MRKYSYLIADYFRVKGNITRINIRMWSWGRIITSRYLCFLGEKLTEAEVDEVTKDCLDPEDEDGMIPYVRKYVYGTSIIQILKFMCEPNLEDWSIRIVRLWGNGWL